NCSAITESLLESELFGHEKGAFTGAEKANRGLFEATGKGTILLDEIGDISPRLQATLLRVLEAGEIRAVGSTETRKIDCRILAATNVNLEQAAQEGIFRTDLIYRLQRLCIHLPPLRERRDDILVLARHFLDTGRRIGVHAVLADAVRKALRGYDWPGNIRELHNVIERMRLMHSDKLSYDITDLDLRFQSVEQAKRDAAEQQSQDVERKERPKARPARDAIPARLRLGDNATRREEPTVDTSPAATGNDLAQNSPVPSTTDLDVERILDTGTSSMRRLVKLRATFAKHQRLTRKEVIQILDVSPNTATKYLQDLTDEGSIKVVSPNGSTRSRYFEYIGEAAAPPA
ncbi:MAG: sigma 54-interacting transcriptional regulator, partial [Verrucomicrobia bacterium]|nr:sigma 54-interacting transcriptional regulator [Verrucomicrobiota bacterium]